MAEKNHRGEVKAKFYFPRNSPAWQAIQRIKATMPKSEQSDSATMRYLVELGAQVHYQLHGTPPNTTELNQPSLI